MVDRWGDGKTGARLIGVVVEPCLMLRNSCKEWFRGCVRLRIWLGKQEVMFSVCGREKEN